MNRTTRLLIPILVSFCTLLWSGSASALWLGLADGNYNVNLTGCSSSDVSLCPTAGSLAIGSNSATFFSFAVNGQLFEGDPADGLQGSNERSDLISSPFSFFSLIHTPDLGQPEFWVYCVNQSSNSCLPIAGFWEATLKTSSVPEPGTFLLLCMGIFGLGYARRSRTI
ncbi:MAG: PEP-CTERM sorting domain-containing protein [Azonexaceae bacterium]|nr:PEP-CTERM sorting domain-containing protein [Azonexaceae bacterium]